MVLDCFYWRAFYWKHSEMIHYGLQWFTDVFLGIAHTFQEHQDCAYFLVTPGKEIADVPEDI